MGNTFRPSGVDIIGIAQPAMRSACEVSACSVLTDVDINAPRGCAPIQPNAHCTTRSPDQVRMCVARMARSSIEILPRPFKWALRGGLCGSVARFMPGHPIARNLKVHDLYESLVEAEGWCHSIASPYATQRRKQKGET